MPHSRSARKRVRQNITRRLRNRSAKSTVKGQVKKFLAAVEGPDAEAARAEFRTTASVLDKAAAHGVLHKNTAARRKSRLAAKLNAKVAAAPKPT